MGEQDSPQVPAPLSASYVGQEEATAEGGPDLVFNRTGCIPANEIINTVTTSAAAAT